MVNGHWTVLDVDITNPRVFHGPFEAVTCISVLEHIVDRESAVRNTLQLLAPGGLLTITTPYNHREPCPNVYNRSDALYGGDLPYICRSHSAQEIEQWQRLGARLKNRELWRLFSGPCGPLASMCPDERLRLLVAMTDIGFDFRDHFLDIAKNTGLDALAG